MKHDLKTLPEYFEKVHNGSKNFEIRKDDRGYLVGDTLILREWDKDNGYSGRVIKKEISYILDNNEYLQDGYVALAMVDGN